MARLTLCALALATVWPTSALAQTCAPGMSVGPETAGRCCWPDQVWSDERNRCDGPPACPDGFYGSGADCIAAPSPAPLAPEPPPEPVPSPPAPAPVLLPVAPPAVPATSPADWRVTFDSYATAGPALEWDDATSPNWAIDGLGVTLFLSGYTPAVTAGAILVGADECTGFGGVLFIPVLGGFIGGFGSLSCFPRVGAPFGAGIIGGAFQVAGLVVLIFGIANPDHRRIHRAVAATEPSVSFGATAEGLGLTLSF